MPSKKLAAPVRASPSPPNGDQNGTKHLNLGSEPPKAEETLAVATLGLMLSEYALWANPSTRRAFEEVEDGCE